MKRILLALLLTLGLATAAIAVPGPEPGRPDFSIDITTKDVAGNKFTDVTEFDTATGWDFGDRDAYACAWVEHFTGGDLDFTTHFQVIDLTQGEGYPAVINDTRGLESTQGLCGGGVRRTNFDGSDHFPHGVSLVFYRDGQEFDRIPYPIQCGNLYWTDGDEPGEVWLWWDEDGASDLFQHGDGLCGGGPAEPEPVVRNGVRDLAPGIDVCTENSDGTRRCTFAEPSPSPSPSSDPSPSPLPSPSPSPSPSPTVCTLYTGFLVGPSGELRYFEICA